MDFVLKDEIFFKFWCSMFRINDIAQDKYNSNKCFNIKINICILFLPFNHFIILGRILSSFGFQLLASVINGNTSNNFIKSFSWGLPRWLSGKDSAYQCRRHGLHISIRKIPKRRKWQPTVVSLPGKFTWTEEPGRLQFMRLQSQTQLSD